MVRGTTGVIHCLGATVRVVLCGWLQVRAVTAPHDHDTGGRVGETTMRVSLRRTSTMPLRRRRVRGGRRRAAAVPLTPRHRRRRRGQ